MRQIATPTAAPLTGTFQTPAWMLRCQMATSAIGASQPMIAALMIGPARDGRSSPIRRTAYPAATDPTMHAM